MQMNDMSRIAVATLEAQAEVGGIEFSMQKRKMVEVFGWHAEAVDLMESQYRKFLALTKALKKCGSEIEIVPTRIIDEFWHWHVLDTMKYHSDCQVLFGGYLHHFPYFGFVDDKDVAAWKQASIQAAEVWKIAFNEDLYGDDDADAYEMDRQFHSMMSATIMSSPGYAAGRCRTACKPVKCK